MMAPTHVAMSLALAAAVATVAPAAAPFVALVALVGGLLPDVDMVVGVHRKTLHQVEVFVAGAVLFGVAAALTPDTGRVLAATGFTAAALHCFADYLGGSSEPRPWEAETDHGIYVRAVGGWVAPRRLASYDGSPGDLALAVAFAVPGFVAFGDSVRLALFGCLLVGVGYSVARKRIPQLSGRTPAIYAALVAFLSMVVRRR